MKKEVAEVLLELEKTIRDMRGAVAPYTRKVTDCLRRLDELRAVAAREVGTTLPQPGGEADDSCG